ncbi:MAG TPA: protein kinase [Thermoanaerobaculia bacterium]
MIGKTIGRYRIVGVLGAGGMGEVFLAEDPQLTRRVAVKVLPQSFAADRTRLQRFFQEARAAAALSHPGVAHIYELGEGEGAPFIAMEYVEGETLADRIQKGSLEVPLATSIAVQVASVLAAAHRKGIIHRDIKPGNIMLDSRGQVKVLDFGVARLTRDSGDAVSSDAATATLTKAGVMIGTLPYMSPEQTLGRAVDARTDIFSFGVVLYEMLVGSQPFHGANVMELADNIVHQAPDAISSRNGDVPPELERIVGKCMEKSADLRYQTADDLLADLKRVERDALTTVESPRRRDASRPRSRIAWALAAAFAVVILSGAAVIWRRQTAVASSLPAQQRSLSSLAVLPFLNTGNQESEYLADGITETLINDLSRIPGMRVMARNSVVPFKGPNQNARVAANRLGVSTVLTGVVNQTGTNIDIDVEWIDAADGSLILSRKYAATTTDIASVPSSVGNDVLARLRLRLTPRQRHALDRETADSEAYQLRLKGLFYSHRFEPQSLHSAIEYDQKAVARDPDYALAYSDMARAYVRLGMYFDPPKEMMPQAKAMAYKALQLDESLPDPRMTLGIVDLLYDRNRSDAEREMVTSSGVEPAAVEAFACTAHFLQTTGRAGDAEKAIRRALRTDPLSPQINTELACNSYYQRHFDEAVKDYRAALEIDPRSVIAYWGLGRALEQKKMYDSAVAELRRVKAVNGFEPPLITAEIAYALARSGHADETRDILRNLTVQSNKTYVDPFLFAVVHLGLNERDQTLAWLNKSVEGRSARVFSMASDPKFDELRGDPRFIALERAAGI